MRLIQRFWDSIKATYKSRTGTVLGAGGTVAWAVWIGARELDSGFGRWADLLAVLVLAAVGIPVVGVGLALLLALLRMLPRLLTGVLVAAGSFVSLLWFVTPGGIFAAVLLILECALGESLFSLLGKARGGKRVVSWCVLVATLGANAWILRTLHGDGVDEEMVQIKEKPTPPAPLTLPDPSKRGPYSVKTLYYGSGDSLRRPEFGPTVAVRTRTVDASAFFKDFDGWKAWVRKRYWGFGMDKLPLNGRVFYPDAKGPFPLMLIVHGNHTMSVPSDNGYGYLCELLASRGFITVSIDENFLNSGLFHDPPKQQAVRGWLLLEHLRQWHAWAKDPKNPFFGKVDLSRIALAGHSRGGEAAATAALFNKLSYFPDDANIRFNYGYAIRSVIAIAPANGQYKPAEQWRVLEDVNYLTMQGANDSDVSSFSGSQQYDRVKFSGKVKAFKSELYIYRANHGQFNTMWGRTDMGAPANWFLNLRPLLAGEQQRQVAKVYISAFLEATLNDRHEYEGLFRDYRRGRPWLPETLYSNRFQDQSYKEICRFNEDADLTTTTIPGGHISATDLTVWREGKIPFRDGNRDYNGVFLGWNWQKATKVPARPPSYTIDLLQGGSYPALALSVAVTEDDAPEPQSQNAKQNGEVEEKEGITNFSIEAESRNGSCSRLAANSFAMLLPPLRVQFTKFERLDSQLYKNAAEPVFQSIHIPFGSFVKTNPSFDPRQISLIRLIFDKTPSRVIIISEIGLEGE